MFQYLGMRYLSCSQCDGKFKKNLSRNIVISDNYVEGAL